MPRTRGTNFRGVEHRPQGFTLVELMVAIAILAILAAIGYPSFQELIISQRVRSATSALYDTLTTARSEALKRSATATIVTTDLAAGWSVSVAGETVLSQAPLSGLTLDPKAPAIAYGPTGRLTSGAGTRITITASGSSTTSCLTLDTTGRPRVTSGKCS